MTESPLLRHQKLTILQQIDELKNWHKQQQLKLNSSCSSQENVELSNENDKRRTLSSNDQNSEINSGSNNNNCNNKASLQNFDDTPVKGTNHHPLIENNIPLLGNQLPISQNNEKPKFRFLRKGEGIARFRMGPVKIKKNNGSNKLNLQPSTVYKQHNKFFISNSKKDIKPIETEKMPFLQPPDLKLNFKNWKSIFNNENALEVIEHAIDNNHLDIFQPNCSIDSSTASKMEKILAVGKDYLKEREEMRVFETIEQHLEDSSFCSTSSYVRNLMENAVMSTPEKTKSYDCDTQSKQFSTTVTSNKPMKNIEKVCDNVKTRDNQVIEPTNSDVDESLHVRFNEEIDYKSFVEWSQSLSSSRLNEKNNIEAFDDCNEWKDDGSDCSSICFSQCNSETKSVNGDNKCVNVLCNADNPNGIKTEFIKQNQKEILDIKDLTVDSNQSSEESTTEEITVIPPILGDKLNELENEIDAFRTENNKLKSIRQQLEKERKQFQLEKKKFLNELEDERKKNATYLEEEKQKLAKEKFIFEKYSKNLMKKPLKEERKEMQALREQLNEMKEELNKKESRWGAAQARVRNQVKHLEEDNKKLREEIEILRRQSKSLQILNQKKNKTTVNNTKLIHAINDHISSIGTDSNDNKSTDIGYFNNNVIKAVIVEDVDPKTMKSIKVVKEHLQETSKPTLNETQNKSQESISRCNEVTANTLSKLSPEPASFHQSSNNRLIERVDLDQSDVTVKKPIENPSTNSIREIISEDGHVEKIYPDGKKEIRLKNGNIKKIDLISGCVKTIYFNGDVKELTGNGTVKYYFSESRIWHTTFPDGLEVLDFPNGQVEKRHTNGTVEIIYPSDCKKITYPDGVEEIFYADGTNIKIDVNKKKILSLPNGQKEIHTDEFVRREYPDGTAKIVYPDGTTETVYSNGRVRLKDKHGNLVMDSGSNTQI